MITATPQGQVTLSVYTLCHQQIVFITVKASRSSVLARQGFPACLLCCLIPLLLTAALIAAWGTVTETCTHAAAYWPTTLSVENQSRNKKQRKREGGKEGKKKRRLLFGQGLERLFPQLSFLWHLSYLMHRSFVCLFCTVWSESKHTTVFSLCHYRRINSTVA